MPATAPARLIAAALLGAQLVVACGGGGSKAPPPTPPAPPTPAPAVSLNAAPTVVDRDSPSTLSWSAANASSCTASGAWSGPRATSGSEATALLTASANFTLTCDGPGGSGSATTTVTFRPTPVISLTANPTRVLAGQTTTLTWSTTDATSCTASGPSPPQATIVWSGTQATSGSYTTPGLLPGPVTFTLDCAGPQGNTRAIVTVDVTPPGSIFLSGLPPIAYINDRVTLNWHGVFVTDCVASGDWAGPRATNGSFTTAPLTTDASYTLTCQDAGGPVTTTLHVSVQQRPPPTVNIGATPNSITAGTATTLYWNTTQATACNASGAWSGSQPTTGSLALGPATNTATYTLTCTGDGGTTSASAIVTVTGPNQPPIADAGLDRSATWGDQVFLGGTGSRDPGGSVDGYAWAQVAGPSVALANANTSLAQFFAPKVTAATVLRFQLIVTDNVGLTSSPDFVDITVEPPAGGIVTVQGRITYERVPFSTTLGSGLDYSATHAEPARGVTVEVSDHGTGFAYVRASTDANGNYAVSVPGNRTLQVTAIAELARTAPQPLPHWNIQVRRGHATSAFLYRASGPAFSSGTGFTADLNIPAGWDAVTRQPNGERAAAPFAILDTLYRSIDKLLTVAPTADFPQVTIDWSTDNGASTTYFDPRDGTDERFISLAGKAGIDIDEYDPHTIAHEFGHYIQDRFARSDSIGGDHAFDDRLDPRVAFGEGFGYAFAAIVLDDPLVRDAIGPTQSSETYFNVESDSVTNEGWYNETSVQEILWDLYDSTNDGSDTLSLGLAPLWAILTGPQRNDESFATIFQFVAALRAANAAFATQIDAIVGGESIVAPTIDRYASTETNAAQVTRTSDVLPVYANIGIGTGAVVVRSIDTFGTYNKLSNRRFLRLQSTGPQRIRITATIAGGHDPDVVVWDRGQRIAAGTVSGNEDFSVNLGTGTYLLETYECANAGCGGVATGPYDISIAVTPF